MELYWETGEPEDKAGGYGYGYRRDFRDAIVEVIVEFWACLFLRPGAPRKQV